MSDVFWTITARGAATRLCSAYEWKYKTLPSGHQLTAVSPMEIPSADNVTSIAGNGIRSGNVVPNHARERQLEEEREREWLSEWVPSETNCRGYNTIAPWLNI